jgi:hypothetical protein
MIGIAVWSIWTRNHSGVPSTWVFWRNQPVAPALPGVPGPTWTCSRYLNATTGVSVSPSASSAMAH